MTRKNTTEKNTAKKNAKPVSSPFGTVELTPEEQYRRERAAGAVRQEHDVAEINAIIANLAKELEQAKDWEKRAEQEYRQAVMKRMSCMEDLMCAVRKFLNN